MIKKIFDEISAESSTIKKMAILESYKDVELLKEVLYLCLSKRIKFYIKQIPLYSMVNQSLTLVQALEQLRTLCSGTIRGYDAIKLLGDVLSSLNPDDAYIVERIIGKDPKIGMNSSNVNKVISNLIETTPYQGAKSYSEKLAKEIFKKDGYAYSDIKMDGRYANAIIRDGEVEFESRQGETTFIPTNSLLVKELSSFNDGVLNGELTMAGGIDRYTANGIIASIVDIEGKRESRSQKETDSKINAFEKKHGNYQENIDKIRYTVWDSITLDNYFDKTSDIEYRDRLDYLYKKTPLLGCTRVSIVERKKVYSFEEAMAHFQEVLLRGEEGTILKSPKAKWRDGKHNHQVKMKLEMNIDLKIIGFEYGNKGTKNENVYSTINLESSCGLLKTNASGMTDSMMKDITKRGENLIGTIVEIRCCGLSKDVNNNWSTLHPSVVELRDDKDTCDSLESAQEIEDMAKGLKKLI